MASATCWKTASAMCYVKSLGAPQVRMLVHTSTELCLCHLPHQLTETMKVSPSTWYMPNPSNLSLLIFSYPEYTVQQLCTSILIEEQFPAFKLFLYNRSINAWSKVEAWCIVKNGTSHNLTNTTSCRRGIISQHSCYGSQTIIPNIKYCQFNMYLFGIGIY